ncbi:hypothetical protein J6590_018228 [Homalodisca vitripennis]|nr:hypothetical protein J6590_018228 [Homalodisca vitripennis]
MESVPKPRPGGGWISSRSSETALVQVSYSGSISKPQLNQFVDHSLEPAASNNRCTPGYCSGYKPGLFPQYGYHTTDIK